MFSVTASNENQGATGGAGGRSPRRAWPSSWGGAPARAAAVVRGAGGGWGFGGPTHKLLAPFRGRPVVTWAVEHAVAAGLDETIVVTGAAEVAGALPPGGRIVGNPRWADGQASSLQAAVQAAADAGHDAVVVGLGDQPLVPSEAWQGGGAGVGAAISPPPLER